MRSNLGLVHAALHLTLGQDFFSVVKLLPLLHHHQKAARRASALSTRLLVVMLFPPGKAYSSSRLFLCYMMNKHINPYQFLTKPWGHTYYPKLP
jgi:hypothetical protein